MRRNFKMQKYENASSGLKMVFIGAIGAIICGVILIIPIIGTIIGGLVFLILSLIGLYKAGMDIDGCKKAFMCNIINLVISVLKTFLGAVPVLGLLLNLAGYVFSFLVVYLVCSSVAAVMRDMGHADIAANGELVYKINFVCYIATIVLSILAVIPLVNILAGLASIVVSIVILVAQILYMIFLYKSSNAMAA